MSRWLNSLQPTAILILRVILGACMVSYGYHKVIPHGALDRHAHLVLSMHLPYWMGYLSAFTEFVGGILVLFGLLTRFVSFLIAINMLFAFFLVGIHNQPGMYFLQLSLAATALLLLCTGAGALSVDRKLGFA